MKLIKESINPKHEKIRNEYKKWNRHPENETTLENVDDWAKTRTCRIQNCSEEQFNEAMFEEYLREDTVEQAAEKELNAEVVTKKGQIEEALDEALESNLEEIEMGGNSFTNVLLIGEAGTAKTSRVRQWARDNNINLYEVRAAGMDDTDLGGAISPGADGTVVRLASTEFDKLNRPNSVLFLDEYNRAPKSVRTNLLELINSHVVPDPREPSGQRVLENFLFTIAAINPANADYDTDTLDMAEMTRFRQIDVKPDPENLLNYLTKTFTQAAETASTPERKERHEGRLALAKALLTNREFEFDNRADIEKVKEEGNGLALNARTLTNLLKGCNGTKEDFLNKWNQYTNSLKFKMAERILSNYQDKNDKANDALKKGTDSEVFKKKDSVLDNINKVLDMF